MEMKQKLATELAIEGIPSRSRIAPFNNKTSSLEDGLATRDFVSAQLRKFYGKLPSNRSSFIKTGGLRSLEI